MRRDNGPSPFAIGIFSAVIGLMAGATAVFFSDKKNRARVRKSVGDMQNQANSKLEEFTGLMSDASTANRKKMATNLRKMAKQLDAPKK